MAYDTKARGNFTQIPSNTRTGVVSGSVDIPASWIPVRTAVTFSFESYVNSVLLFTTNINFPEQDNPSETNFSSFDLPNYSPSGDVLSQITIQVQGQNKAGGVKKIGTVTNSPPQVIKMDPIID